MKIRTKKNFKVSNASLDLETIEDGDNDSVSIWVNANKTDTLLATLNQNIPQAQIDVAFGKNHSVEFYVRSTTASATVHLSGYDIYDEESSSDDDAEHTEGTSTKVH